MFDRLGIMDPSEKDGRKVVICIPLSGNKPYPQCIDALEASAPVLTAAGYDHYVVTRKGPYISHNRAELLRRAMDAKADIVVFIDHDLSWRPEDLLALIRHDSDVTSGLYRLRCDDVQYMGVIDVEADGRPLILQDGTISGRMVPAGFLKLTKRAVHDFMTAYPELCYGPRYSPAVDLFQHGANDGIWWGEDYRFAMRWRDKCGDIHVLPDLDLTHWHPDGDGYIAYPGNYHRFLLAQPGGSMTEQAQPAVAENTGSGASSSVPSSAPANAEEAAPPSATEGAAHEPELA